MTGKRVGIEGERKKGIEDERKKGIEDERKRKGYTGRVCRGRNR